MDNWQDLFKGVEHECMTYQERYGDARGLCDRIWGDNYYYSDDEDNCAVMSFEGPNPNLKLKIPVSVTMILLCFINQDTFFQKK